jgi:hypothetical protein
MAEHEQGRNRHKPEDADPDEENFFHTERAKQLPSEEAKA